MIDYKLYRARIGAYDLRTRSRNCWKTRVNKLSNVRRMKCSWNLVTVVCLGFVLFTLGWNIDNFSNPGPNRTKPDLNLKPGIVQCMDAGIRLFVPKFNTTEWNSFMKATNGNIKQCMNVAHWNGGSSHLGKSTKGKEKLEHVKFL